MPPRIHRLLLSLGLAMWLDLALTRLIPVPAKDTFLFSATRLVLAILTVVSASRAPGSLRGLVGGDYATRGLVSRTLKVRQESGVEVVKSTRVASSCMRELVDRKTRLLGLLADFWRSSMLLTGWAGTFEKPADRKVGRPVGQVVPGTGLRADESGVLWLGAKRSGEFGFDM